MLRGLFALIFYFLQKKLAKPAKLCYTYWAVPLDGVLLLHKNGKVTNW